MVPFLYLLYARLGVARDPATTLAHATSLAVIVPTAIRGLIGYRGSGRIRWASAVPLAITGALSAAVTAQFATRVPSTALRLGFGVFLVLVSLDLLVRAGHGADEAEPEQKRLVTAALLGIPVGALSAVLGIGGGVLATMGMHYFLKLPFSAIPATSLAVIVGTAIAGSVSYIFQPLPGLPFGGTLGHVDLMHGLPLAVGAVLGAPLGVRLNKRMPVMTLRRVFGGLLALIGIQLIVANT